MDSGRTALTVALVPTGGEGGGLDLSVRGGDDTGASAEQSAVGFYTFSAGGGGVRQAAGDGEAKVSVGKELSRTLILLSIVCFPSECLHPSLPENPASLAGGGVHENLAEGSWV